MTTAEVRVGGRTSWGADARGVGWWLAVGVAAGALAGLILGGIGGRVLMLLLRSQSPEARGVVSDDGFEIGRVSAESANLLVFGAAAGALFGALYVALRGAVPARLRIPLATLLGGVVGGVAFINPDGIDLLVLEPTWLAVSGFVLLPALSAMVTAILVERWSRVAPWSLTRRQMLAFTPAALAAPVLPILILGGGAALLVGRLRTLRALGPVLRIAVPALLVALLVYQARALVGEIGRVA